VRNFSSVNRGRWRFFTTCTGSPSFHTNSRSSVVQPSARQAISPLPNCAGFEGGNYEALYFLGYNSVSVSQLIFQRNISPPSSGSKNKPSSAGYLLLAGIFAGLILRT
jgi:hypothetical protein